MHAQHGIFPHALFIIVTKWVNKLIMASFDIHSIHDWLDMDLVGVNDKRSCFVIIIFVIFAFLPSLIFSFFLLTLRIHEILLLIQSTLRTTRIPILHFYWIFGSENSASFFTLHLTFSCKWVVFLHNRALLWSKNCVNQCRYCIVIWCRIFFLLPCLHFMLCNFAINKR